MDFAPGGTIRINGSYGDLSVEGWDRPEVEMTVIKTLPYASKPKPPEQSTATLDQFRIVTEHKTPLELTISTELPSRHPAWIPPFTRHTTHGVIAEYEIHVPRDSRLVIQHGTGTVSVNGVAGDIDALVGRATSYYGCHRPPTRSTPALTSESFLRIWTAPPTTNT